MARIAPTDRSIPPAIITNVIPSATILMTAVWRTTLERFVAVRKFGEAMASAMNRMISVKNGSSFCIMREAPPELVSWQFRSASETDDYTQARPAATAGSTVQLLFNRQLANSLSGCREDRIANRRSDWWYPGLAYARWSGIAGHDVLMRFHGRLAHARYRVSIEIRLLDFSTGGGNLTHERDTGSEHRRAFELRFHPVGIDHPPGIQSEVHARNPDLASVHFHLDDRCYVGQETAVGRNAERASRDRLAIRPVRFVRHDLDNVPQSRGVERELRIAPSRLLQTFFFEVDGSWLADELQQIFHAIAARAGRQFIGERLYAEGMVNVRNRPQPSNANMRPCRSVLDSQIGDGIRDVCPAHAKLTSPIHRVRIALHRDRWKHAAMQPR